MDNSKIYGQDNFNLPHDVVPLPSQGKFYPSGKKSLKVGYLTASDENLLMSQNLKEVNTLIFLSHALFNFSKICVLNNLVKLYCNVSLSDQAKLPSPVW